MFEGSHMELGPQLYHFKAKKELHYDNCSFNGLLGAFSLQLLYRFNPLLRPKVSQRSSNGLTPLVSFSVFGHIFDRF